MVAQVCPPPKVTDPVIIIPNEFVSSTPMAANVCPLQVMDPVGILPIEFL